MKTFTAIAISAFLLLSATAAANEELSLRTARSQVRAWLEVQARTGPVEGGSSLDGVQATKCKRRSTSHVVCDGVVHWRDDQDSREPRYVCLFRKVSVRRVRNGFMVGQAVGESRCAGSLEAAESMTGFR